MVRNKGPSLSALRTQIIVADDLGQARVNKANGVAPAAKVAQATQDQVRNRAYAIFLARGAAPGSDLDDWIQAERELKVSAKRGR